MTAKTRLDFGVETPISITNPGPYDWHVWRREPHGDIWMGFFRDDKVAVAWAQSRPTGNYVVNNVPPNTSRRYIVGGSDDGRPWNPPRYTGPVARPTVTPRRKPATAPRTVAAGPSLPAPAPVPVDTAAARKLRKDAQTRLDEVRADEAKDIADGTVEVV